MRLTDVDSSLIQLSQVVEAVFVTCCDFPDSDFVVTGLEDTTVCIWRIDRRESVALNLSTVMRGHERPATCISTSRSWSMIVTGSKDCSAIIWDLNRGRFVRRIKHGSEILSCAIQESSVRNQRIIRTRCMTDETTQGCIATCSRDVLQVHTINAHLIASVALSTPHLVRCLAFHEREWTPIPVLATGGSDGSITLRTWNAKSTPQGAKAVWEFVTLHTYRCREDIAVVPSIESLKFSGQVLAEIALGRRR